MNNRSLQEIEKKTLLELREKLVEKKYKLIFEDVIHLLVFRFYSYYISSLIAHPWAFERWKTLANATEMTQKFKDYQVEWKQFEKDFLGKECTAECKAIVNRFGYKEALPYLSKLSEFFKFAEAQGEGDKIVYLTNPNTLSLLKNMIGKTAWFSNDHLNFIELDNDWNTHMKHMVPEKKYNLITQSLVTSVNTLLTIKKDALNYENDENIRAFLNLKHDADSRYVSDPLAKYKIFLLFCYPLEFSMSLVTSGIATKISMEVMKRLLRSFHPQIMQRINIFESKRLTTEKKHLLLNNKELEINLLSEQVEKLEQDVKRIGRIKSALYSLWLAYTLFDICQDFYKDHYQDDEPFKSLLQMMAKMLFAVSSVVSFMYSLRGQYQDKRLELYLVKIKEQLLKATVDLNINDIKVYKSIDLKDSLFVLSIQGIDSLTARQVAKIVINKLENQGCQIEASYTTKNDKIQKIGIKINHVLNGEKLGEEIKTAINNLHSIQTLKEQMGLIAKIIGASVLIVPFKNEKNEVMGDVTFAFSNQEQANFWFSGILEHNGFSNEDKMLQGKRLPYSIEDFNKFCELCHEIATRFNKISLSEVRKTLLQQKLSSGPDILGRCEEEKGIQEKTGCITERKSKEALKTQKNKKSVNETKKVFAEIKHDVPFNCPSPYIRINNSPFWSKPHFMQFSLTINDFNGDKVAYETCMKKVFKKGLATAQQGSEGLIILGDNETTKSVKDCTVAHQKFKPYAKFKVLGNKGKIRLFAEKKLAYVAEVNDVCEVYDLKGIDLKH